MKYHFRNKEGWLGSPCGLIFFQGRYHAFCQCYPNAPRFGPMHWGHIISDDLITWEEAPIAIAPDKEYENQGGCSGGSAIVKDGKIYLFYSSSSSELGETISSACSEDGINFVKNPDNPIINNPLEGSSLKLRDPYVMRYNGKYLMVAGAGASGIAKVLLFTSDNLISWQYEGEILSDSKFGSVIESPELFEVDGKWVFMIQSEKSLPSRVLFATGDFDGKTFEYDNDEEPFASIETGKEFLNPVTFEDRDGRRILIAWMFSTRIANSSVFTAPREIYIDIDDNLVMMPIPALRDKCVSESRFVSYEDGRLRISFERKTLMSKAYASCPDMIVLEDVGTVEVFIGGGRENITMFIC